MRICSIKSQAQAGLIANRLKEEGINALPLNTSAHISIGGANHCYYIEVSDCDAQEAKTILADLGYEKDLI